MSRLKERLERDLREIAACARPSPSAWESISARLGDDEGSEVDVVLLPTHGVPKRRIWPAVTAAALVVVIGLITALTRVGDDPSISPADLGLTGTFVSPRNGFSVNYDSDVGTVTPAKQLLGLSTQANDGFDVVETGFGATFRGASTTAFRPGVLGLEEEDGQHRGRQGSIDEQVDGFLSNDQVLPDGCGVPRDKQAEITIDGEPGRIAECPNHIEATVIARGRLYLFTLSHDRADRRAVFDAFVATISLSPGTAISFPGLTSTFVSPTYGYSFRYYDRGGLAPATKLWDPANPPPGSTCCDERFDGVETGDGAYFASASTPIPAGVSIDEWVDERITPRAAGGCGVPRSQQPEVTIDGQSGRTSECRPTNGTGTIQATVVTGGRLYFFTLGHGRSDARAWFDAWIATVDLTPETAVAV